MKKTMKRLVITTIAIFAILGVSGTLAYASGYLTWAGTQDYQQALVNQLKADKQNLIDIYVERSTDYVNEIISLEQQIETLQDMLQQAE